MANQFLLKADFRDNIGKGASRRLRRENKIPAIVYGGQEAPQSITVSHFKILKYLNDDSFYSQIIDIEVEGEIQETILRDLQRHPYKPSILHADFQRVVRGQELTVNVPIHYLNAESAKGVKLGGILSQHIIDIEIACRPSDLPEALEVDITELDMNEALRLSDITLPEGVRILMLEGLETENDEHNINIVSIHPPKAEKVSEVVSADSADNESTSTTEDSAE
ncbi:MAG: 50S ribosomal protein L25/general stress protein Ctc [Ostreibacterium sp.]